jgi:hypothetical protein
LASAICGNDNDLLVLVQAIKIAEFELVLSAIPAQKVAAVEQVREPYVARSPRMTIASS